MNQNYVNQLIRDCECKRPMNHDRKNQERKHQLFAYGIIAAVVLIILASILL